MSLLSNELFISGTKEGGSETQAIDEQQGFL